MKIYPSYESTNDRFWNNDIPSNWGIKRIGSVFTQRNEKVSDTDYEPLSVTKKGIFPQWENVSKSDSHDNRKLVLKNDFVINSRSDRRGSSGLSKLDGSVSLINTVLTPSNEVEPKYSEYIFKSYEFINEFYKNGRGIVDDLWSTKYSLMKNIYICIPSHTEQKQIVSFLDTKTQKIDELIDKTEQKIELLKEKRTSLINHCVTKGLNPDVEMKDSGVEWIGEIPSDWEVKPIKYISGYNQDSIGSETPSDYELDYLEISDVNSVGEIGKPTHYTFSKSPSRCRRILNKNDIIISTVRTYLRSIGFIENEVQNLICSTGFCVLTPKNMIEPKLLFYLVRSEWFISKVISKSVGVSYPGIQTEKLMSIKVLLPPISEQTQIVEYLDEHTKKIDSTIEKETQRTELLKEYRQSLISEVVTGKIDVRDYNG